MFQLKKKEKKNKKTKKTNKQTFFLEKNFWRFLVFGIMKNESQVTNGFNPNTPSFPPFPCALTASIPLCCQHHHHYHCHCLHCHTNITTTPTTSATATTPLTMLPPSPPPLWPHHHHLHCDRTITTTTTTLTWNINDFSCKPNNIKHFCVCL